MLFVGSQSPSTHTVFEAATRCYAVFAPVDPGWPLPRITAYAKRVAATVAVVDDASAAGVGTALTAAMPALEVLASTELTAPAAPGNTRFSRHWMAGPAPAVYLPTSGSTGEPKIVVLSQATLQRSAELAVRCFQWRSGERLLNLAEPHTMSGLRNALVAAPLAGMSWLSSPPAQRRTLFELLDQIASLRPHRLVAAPMLLRQINLLGDRLDREALGSLKAVYCTGTDLDHDEVRCFHARFGLPVLNYYGLTETAGLCVSQSLDDWTPNDRSIGRAVGCELRVLRADGATARVDEPGELQVLQPLPMRGYLDDAAATAARFDGPWLRTGDVARIDRHGRTFLVGRSDSFIKSLGTEKIHPREIETVLLRHPSIADAAACGLPARGGGERIAIALVARSSEAIASDHDLIDWVLQHLGPAFRPSQLEWVSEIPRGAHGKALRHELARLFDHD